MMSTPIIGRESVITPRGRIGQDHRQGLGILGRLGARRIAENGHGERKATLVLFAGRKQKLGGIASRGKMANADGGGIEHTCHALMNSL